MKPPAAPKGAFNGFKGKGKGKGRSKGVWQVDGEEEDWQWDGDEEDKGVNVVTERDSDIGGWRTAGPRRRTLGDFMGGVHSVSVPGEVGAVSEQEGWEKIRAQIDSGAIDTVGPRSVAKALQMKETAMSKKGIGYVAANGSSVKT